MLIMFLGLIITVIATVFSYKKLGKDNFLCHIVSFLILSLGLELTLFNVNYYTTLKNKPISLNSYIGNAESIDFDIENNSFEIKNIDKEINNLYFDIENTSAGNIDVNIYFTDDANSSYFTMPKRTINGNVEKSKFINIHPSGNVDSLKIIFNLSEDEALTLTGITANAKRSFDFSLLRVITVFLICLFFELFKSSSFLYKSELIKSKALKHNILVMFLFFQCFVFITLIIINPTFVGISTAGYNEHKWDGSGVDFVPLSMENHNQYDELAQSFLKGKTYIDNGDIPEFLSEMNNPYDTIERTTLAELTGESVRWDVAYYNGHYYVYFGIVPLLLMYLPFRLIFNAPFPSAFGILIFAILFTIGVYLLLSQIAKEKFKNISVGTFFLTLFSFVNCCGLIFLVKRPDFYSVPIITGMTFSVFGIYFWLKALSENSKRKIRFFTGSLCMALVAGCRPQLVLLSFIALPLFISYFFKDKYILKKDGIKEFVVLAIPYITVAAGLMYYNYIRFGSPFDFGSSYNLTTNDVTNRGFDIGRIGLGIFTYLFQTPVFTSVFPFLQKADISTNYVGKTIYENCFGGLITCTPVLWFIFSLPKVKNALKERKLLFSTVLLIIIGLSLVVLDTEAGGLLQRYYGDFGFIFFSASAIIIFALYDNKKNKSYFPNSLLTISTFFGIFYVVCLAFSVSDVTIDTQNPTLFTFLSETVQFWL